MSSIFSLNLPEIEYEEITLRDKANPEVVITLSLQTEVDLVKSMEFNSELQKLIDMYCTPTNGEMLSIPVGNGVIHPTEEMLKSVASVYVLQNPLNKRTAEELIVLAYVFKSFAHVVVKVSEKFEDILKDINNPFLSGDDNQPLPNIATSSTSTPNSNTE